MEKLKALFSALFIALTFSSFAQTQNPIWCVPPYYLKFPIGFSQPTLDTLPEGTNGPWYQGHPAHYCANAIEDASGNLSFFIVDNILYKSNGNQPGYYEGALSYSFDDYHNYSEVAVAPFAGNCNKFYIMTPQNFSTDLNTDVYNTQTGGLDFQHQGLIKNKLPIPKVTAHYGFDPLIAVSTAFNNGTRLVFTKIYNYTGTKITDHNEILLNVGKLDGTGYHYISSKLVRYAGLVGNGPASIHGNRSELECVELPGGNFRVAVPFFNKNLESGVYIYDYDQNGNFISGSQKTIIIYNDGNGGQYPQQESYVKGLEFSDQGRYLYITHYNENVANNGSPMYPDNVLYYDVNTQTIHSLNGTNNGDFAFSQIELGQDGKMYFAYSGGMATYSNPNNPGSGTWTIPAVSFTNSPSMGYGSNYNPQLHELYLLPDQIDGEDYGSIFGSSTECCVNNTDYDAVADTVGMTNTTWSPGLGNNPWNSVSGIISVKKDLVIGINTLLTIQNMTFRFAPGAKVVVERGGGNASHIGGRLILDNSIFTADTDCNAQNMWLGVRVQGYQNNTTQTQQGGLILKNNSVIENAYKGAVAAKVSPIGNPYTPSGFTYDYSYAGGRIQATNSSFIDNVNDVEILNFDAANDPGNFTNCRFITNRALNNPTLFPIYHAKLVNVKNVQFSGCDFENTTTVWNSGTYFQAGTGIYSEDAQYSVSARCLSGTSPCTNYDSCHLSGLQWGVSATNNLSSRTVSVDRSVFANNLTGIYLSTVDEATITRNNFHIPAVQFGETIGSFLTNCTGYTVQENKLSGLGHSLNPSNYGIIIDNSGAAENLVYKNSFTQLFVGGQSQGQNAQTNGKHEKNDEGLHWYCNTFTTNTIHKADLAVASGEISYHQGDQQGAADNSFSHTASPAYDIWTNPGVMIFDYYYNSGNPVYDPLRINNTSIAWAYPTSIDTNTCPSLLNNGGIVIGPPVGIGGFFMQQLSARSDSLKGAIAQKRSKIDGGNSVNMFNSIGRLGRDILRADLLNASPYLSDKVLLKYIETPLVPNDYKLQVLLANSPLSDSVMQVLSNFNLPSRMMQQINAAQTGISARTDLYDVISSLKRKLAYNRNTRLRIYLNDTTNSPASMDSVIAVLQRENSEAAKKQLCDVYIGMGNSSAATALRNEIAAEYGTDDYTDLLGISLQLSQSPKGLFALKDSAGLLAQVEQIAYSSVGKAASAKAKAMLSAALDTTFLPVVEPLIGTNNQRRADGGNNQQPKYNNANTLLIYPNPTDRNNGVVIALQSKNNAKMTAPTVKIYDVMGRLAGVYRMGGKQTKITVPTNELESGIYFVKLYFDGNYIETQKLVVK